MRHASTARQTIRCTILLIGCILARSRADVEYDLNMDRMLGTKIGRKMAANVNTKYVSSGSRQWLSLWIWIASIWFGLGLFDATQTVLVMRSEGMHHAWITLFVTTVLSWLPWALATPLVLRLGHRFPPVKLRPLSTWLIHIAACVAIGLTFAAWTTWLQERFNPYGNSSPPSPFVLVCVDKFDNGVLSFVVLYAAILAANYVLDSRKRLAFQQTETARLNEQLAKAQLTALRQQIEPHFLFNTLNAVSGLVREGRNDAAVSMIAALSDFLRRVLEESTRQQVPLAEEIEFAQKYLDIQKVRFADRLQLSIDVPSDLHQAQVPSLILQPMVENAVKHGIAKRARGGTIRIAASRASGTLTLTVSNDGPSLPPDWEITTGIGMSNVRTRLKSLYSEAFTLTMRNQDADGVEVSISLPFVPSPAPVSLPVPAKES
jgi:two-component system, LytTR family, sensor kinase